MQTFLKKWFGDKTEFIDDAQIVVDADANKVARKKSDKESGATAIEYALIASLIAVAIITATTTLGDKVANTFDDVSDQLQA